MSNVKHPKCPIRNMANSAKARLCANTYFDDLNMGVPKNITPQQKQMYLKICEIKDSGEELINPIQQLADTEKMNSLSHEEKQRYIMQLSADYVCVKNLVEQHRNTKIG